MPLPELQPSQPVQQQSAQSAQPVQPIQPPAPAQQVIAMAQPAPAPQPAPTAVAAPVEAGKPAETAMPRATAPRSRRAGLSLGSLLSEDTNAKVKVEALSSDEDVDPDCEAKLMGIKAQFVEILSKGRMRYVPVFETMMVKERLIQVTVPSKELFEEIMRDKLEWLKELQKLAGLKCSIDLEVIINEAVRIARPITIEDRLRHLVAKNDRLKEMIEVLVLDAE